LAVDIRKADEGTISRDLSELFLALGEAAAAKKTGVVFLLDEVQFVSELEYRSLISALHRATQKNMPITVAAAGLPQIPRLTGEARSYAERLFTFPVIASLSDLDARAAPRVSGCSKKDWRTRPRPMATSTSPSPASTSSCVDICPTRHPNMPKPDERHPGIA